MGRIGDAIARLPGDVLVTGHTDNQPVARSARFPSNFQLSEQRALTVKDILVAHRVAAERIRAEGRAEWEPLNRDNTPAARATNRRVEGHAVRPAERRRDPARGRPGDREVIRRLLGLVFNRWVFLALIFIGIALAIWTVGPLVAIGEKRPLYGDGARLIAIAIGRDRHDRVARDALLDGAPHERRRGHPVAGAPRRRRTGAREPPTSRPSGNASSRRYRRCGRPASARTACCRAGRAGSAAATSTSCPGTSSSAPPVRARPPHWSAADCSSRCNRSSARAPCRASAARATATGGSPTRPC